MIDSDFNLVQKDEQELIQLFDKAHQLRDRLPNPKAPISNRNDAGELRTLSQLEQEIVDVEQQILTIVDGYFRQCLPGLMVKRFGGAVVDSRGDAVVRFSAMLNNFFVKVLEQRPDAFWRIKTSGDLRKWAGVVLGHLISDEVRNESTHSKYQHKLWKALRPLIEERKTHFQKSAGLPLDPDVLDQIARWKNSSELRKRQLGQVLELHYLVGYTYTEIAELLECSVETVHNRRDEALLWLRDHRR